MFYNIPRKPVRASGFSLALFSFHNLINRFPVVIMAAGFFEDISFIFNINFGFNNYYDYALPSVRIAGFL